MTECVTENEIIEKVQKDTCDDVNITYKEIKEPYGFIYITTNLVNGKRYLGQRKFSKGWKNYLGSGSVFSKAVEKYQPENFQRNIIDIAYSKEELCQKEYEYGVFFNVVESKDWYNLVNGGNSMAGYRYTAEQRQARSELLKGHVLSDETKAKISRKAKERLKDPKNHPMYGKHIHVGENNPFYGKSHTEESRKKISRNNIGKNMGLDNPKSILVYCINSKEIFVSISSACLKYHIGSCGISECCCGTQKTAGKDLITGEPLRWKYVYDQTNKKGVVVQGAITLGYITKEQVDEYLNNLKQKGNDTNG